MMTRASAVEFRQHLGEMLSQVLYRRDAIVIDKDGRPATTTCSPSPTALRSSRRRSPGRNTASETTAAPRRPINQ